jgi:hypothetical protein
MTQALMTVLMKAGGNIPIVRTIQYQQFTHDLLLP